MLGPFTDYTDLAIQVTSQYFFSDISSMVMRQCSLWPIRLQLFFHLWITISVRFFFLTDKLLPIRDESWCLETYSTMSETRTSFGWRYWDLVFSLIYSDFIQPRQVILETISLFAMVINAALIAFTGLFAVNYTWAERIWIFVCTAFGLYMFVA